MRSWWPGGTYNENELDPGEYESILGGYHPENWERDIAAYPTVIDAGDSESNVIWGADHCTIEGLTIRNAGRGVFCYGASPTITRCTFTSLTNGISTAEGATITRNMFENNGRGIFAGTNTGFTTAIENNLILSSMGTIASGIINVSNNMNCVNNTIDYCGDYGIRVQKSSTGGPPVVVLQNNNITRNGSDYWGDGIYLSANAEYSVDTGLITISHNNVWGNHEDYDIHGTPVDGDISRDPLYRDPLSVSLPGRARVSREEGTTYFACKERDEWAAWERGPVRPGRRAPGPAKEIQLASYNYHLDPGSPSIDAGENQGAPPVDLDGRLRPNPSSSRVDIGCYEYYAGALPSSWIYDYNGDGTSDIGIFRPSSGLWAVRGVTRVYFGSSADLPAPGDYDGDGTTDIGIFRNSVGLWAIRGLSRVYFGSASDTAAAGDYNGDGSWDIGIFRDTGGLWALRGLSRIYFGTSGDNPVPGYYAGEPTREIGIFRDSTSLWAVRGVTRVYFGTAADSAVPGDYDGNGSWEVGVFRPSAGLWAIRGVTRRYFGGNTDEAVPADYAGKASDGIGIFRPSTGLWAIAGLSRTYFGSVDDLPVTR